MLEIIFLFHNIDIPVSTNPGLILIKKRKKKLIQGSIEIVIPALWDSCGIIMWFLASIFLILKLVLVVEWKCRKEMYG